MLKKFSVFLVFLGVIFIVLGLGFDYIKFASSDELMVPVSKRLNSKQYNKFYSAVQETAGYFDLYFSSEFENFDVNQLNDRKKTLFILNLICDYRSSEVSIEEVITVANQYFSEFNLYQKSIYSDENLLLFKYQNGKFTYSSSNNLDYIMNTVLVSNDAYSDSWILKKKLYFVKIDFVNGQYVQKIYKSISDLQHNQEIYSFISDTPMSNVDNFAMIEAQLDTYVYQFRRKKNFYLLDTVKVED